MRYDKLGRTKVELSAQNADLQSQLSSGGASQKIQQQARTPARARRRQPRHDQVHRAQPLDPGRWRAERTGGSGSSSLPSPSSSRSCSARAVWLQGVQGAVAVEARSDSSSETLDLPAHRGHDLRPHAASSSRSASRRRPSTPTRARCASRASSRVAAGTNARRRRERRSTAQLTDRKRASSTSQRKADPAKAARCSRSVNSPASASIRRSAASIRRARSARTCSATRARQPRARRARAAAGQDARRQPGQQTRVDRPVRPRRRRRERAPPSDGPRRLPHDRPHDPGERRSRAAADGRRSGTRRARPPSCSIRAPARCSRWPTRRASTRTLRERPRRRCTRNRAVTDIVRARLDVQARHGRGRALGRARHAADDVHAARLDPCCRPRDPRRGGARHGDDERRADPRALVERRRDHAGREARPEAASPTGSRASASARTTGIGFPGESPGFVLPPDQWSGSTIGNVPIGQGIAVTPVQMAAAYAAIANRGVWVQPHLVEHIGGKRAAARVDAARSSRRGVAARAERDAHDVVVERHRHARPRPRLPGGGQDGDGGKAGPHGGYSTRHYVASFVGMSRRRSRSCS